MLGSLLLKDARLLVRNRALLVALLLYPLLLAAVLGAAFRDPPSHLDLVVWNGDAGGASLDTGGGAKLDAAAMISQASSFATLHDASSEADAIAMVRQGKVDAALLVPKNFVADLARFGGNATLRVVVDESDPVRAGIAKNAVVGGVDAFVKLVVARKVADVETLLNLTVHGGTTQVVGFNVDVLGIERARAALADALSGLDANSQQAQEVRNVIAFLDFASGVLGNSQGILTTTAVPLDVQTSGLAHADTRLVSVALPGALVLSLFWTGALAAALLAARERETGVARRLAAARPPLGLVAGSKTLVALLAALLPAALVLAIGVAALGADVHDPALTLLVLVLSSVVAASLGALCASLARASAAATLLAVLALVPLLLLGGLFYPVAYMPTVAQAIAKVLPLTLATDALRGAMVRGSGFAELGAALAGLAAWAVAMAGGAALISKR